MLQQKARAIFTKLSNKKPGGTPATTGTRKPADTVQTYFDTEKQEYRCFKKANLIRIA